MASRAIGKLRFRPILPLRNFRWLLMPSESVDFAHTSSKKASDGCPCHRKVTIPPHTSSEKVPDGLSCHQKAPISQNTSSKKFPMASHAIGKWRFRPMLPRKKSPMASHAIRKWRFRLRLPCNHVPGFISRFETTPISRGACSQPRFCHHVMPPATDVFARYFLHDTFVAPCHGAQAAVRRDGWFSREVPIGTF